MSIFIDLIAAVERGRTEWLERDTPEPGDRPDERGEWTGDAMELAIALRARIRGEVRFDDGSRALYSTDASNYRQIPIGVVVPLDVDDIIATVEIARRFDAPILARGGGTSLAGQCCNVAVVLDFSKHVNRILEVNVEEKWARIEPGLVTDALNKAVKPHGLIFGPDPATHDHNTFGGMIGNNSCGMHAQMAGKVEENVLELDILTYDGVRLTVGPTSDAELEALSARTDRVGELYAGLRALRDGYADEIRARFPDIPRRVSGYPLQELLPENGFNVARALVGTECTCAIVLSAKVRLVHNPEHRTLVVLGYPDVFQAADRVPIVNTHRPLALEGLDETLIDDMRLKRVELQDSGLLPQGQAWLMAEFGDDDAERAAAIARKCEAELRAHGVVDSVVFTDPGHQQQLKDLREAGLGASTKRPGKADNYEGWEDSAVPPDRLGNYLRELRALYDKHGYESPMYGHFGQGCIHCRVTFDLRSPAGIANWRSFMREAAELIRHYGGSLSGEHGDGQSKAEFLPVMYGETIVAAFGEFKRLWDPRGRMNPGKVVDPYPIDSNLREGPYYRPWQPSTHFSFAPHDRGSFAYAANRCVGVGKCRRHEGATMCPSYRVTGDEQHSTRGRARLLFEMLEGDPLTGGWESEAVKEALDLCLSCKGCVGDCPVNVDMATYKAEFLAHYYEKRLRPIWAYAFGLIPWWAHIASLAPRVVNAVAQTPPLSWVAKAVVKMAPQRRVPQFADEPFRVWWHKRRQPHHAGGVRVVLWADTFNNYFHADTARHAVDVLEAAGCNVVVPKAVLCCGRPLYDYGMLDLAKTMLREVLAALRSEIEAGTPIIVLEPSCASVFKEELVNLFPHDQDALRLRDLVTPIGDFLNGLDGWVPPRLEREILVHGHCHHKALIKMDGMMKAIEATGADAHFIDAGCCGMAGAFGFEAGEHYEVSVKAGELKLLPAVREAKAETIIIGDGFSCREQIAQTTERQALHIADVLWLALKYGSTGPPGDRPEFAAMPDARGVAAQARRDGAVGFAAIIASVAAIAGIRAWLGRR